MPSKILLVYPSIEKESLISKTNSWSYTIPTPGLLYLDIALKKEGKKVFTKNYYDWDEKDFLSDLKDELKNFNPSIVGFSVLSFNRVSTYKAIKIVKNFNKNIKIILGGIHASAMYQQLLINFDIDVICLGESDYSIIEVVKALENNNSLNEIRGIAFKFDSKIILTPPRELIRDLDGIPFIDHKEFIKDSVEVYPMVSSRGCPNQCTYCCLNFKNKRLWRARSYKNVVDEIEIIYNNFPQVKRIYFYDDNFTTNNQRVIDICKEIISRKIKLEFECQGRLKPISKEMILWMEKAGFKNIGFGLETGSPRLLKSIKKNITQEDCIKTFNVLKDFKNIKVSKFLIVGFPGETEETVDETIEFVRLLNKIIPIDYFYAYPLWIYPNTEIYEGAKKKGFIDDHFWLTDKPCPIYTLEHSEKWLRRMSNKITIKTMISMGKFYFIKRIIMKFISRPVYYSKRILRK